MDIIKLTRELGAAIQQDDRYAKFQAAQKANEEDKDLNDLMGKIQLVHMSISMRQARKTPTSRSLLHTRPSSTISTRRSWRTSICATTKLQEPR